ncbi:MAG: HlyD family type I secretion periplasmic adaptor subunit [Chlorobiaceae bacterium]|nr:HlyD family type I secretion periplasmic adaptor subunit [Chlorobiaceae bacterium]
MNLFARHRQYVAKVTSLLLHLRRRVCADKGAGPVEGGNFRLRWQAFLELMARYRHHVAHFWSIRHELTPPDLKAHESEFLPSALALQTTPVSPAGRWVARVLMALLTALLLWSVLGRMDIIVNATGKIIPSDRSKTISSVETARVDGLFVEEGKSVAAGDLLIELDTRMSDRERDKAAGDRETALLQVERSRALLASIAADRLKQIDGVEGVSAGRVADARRHLESQWQDFEAKLIRLDGEMARYRRQLPLITQKADDYRILAQDHDVSVHAWQEKEQDRIELEGRLADVANQRRAHIAETRKNAQDALNDGLRQAQSSGQDAERAAAHSDLLRLRAPVAGTVQQLTVHTVGGVVQSAQPLMVIVPRRHQVEVEAFIDNKDVGFVAEGQRAQVKIETFDYTKYGTLSGRVSHVSRDAIDPNTQTTSPSSPKASQDDPKQDSPGGPVYAIKVLLDKSSMAIDGHQVELTPGMSVSIEIKTGSRRIIEYFLSPLIQHAHESFNQR